MFRIIIGWLWFLFAQYAHAAITLRAELTTGAGHDNALFRLLTELPTLLDEEDNFWLLSPKFNLGWQFAEKQQLELSYSASLRQFQQTDNGQALAHNAGIHYGYTWRNNLQSYVQLDFLNEKFTALSDNNYAWYGLNTGVYWQPTATWQLSLAALAQQFQGKIFETKQAGLSLSVDKFLEQPSFGARIEWLHDASSQERQTLQVWSTYVFDSFRWSLDAGLSRLENGIWRGVGGEFLWQLHGHWSLVTRYQGQWESYDDVQGLLLGHLVTFKGVYVWPVDPLFKTNQYQTHSHFKHCNKLFFTFTHHTPRQSK